MATMPTTKQLSQRMTKNSISVRKLALKMVIKTISCS
jgi:hypothetical protein